MSNIVSQFLVRFMEKFGFGKYFVKMNGRFIKFNRVNKKCFNLKHKD